MSLFHTIEKDQLGQFIVTGDHSILGIPAPKKRPKSPPAIRGDKCTRISTDFDAKKTDAHIIYEQKSTSKGGDTPFLAQNSSETRAIIALDWLALSINLIRPISTDLVAGDSFMIDPEFVVGKFWRKIYKVVRLVDGRAEVYADLETDNVHDSVKHSNLRIHNKWLYGADRDDLMRDCMAQLGFQFRAISRIDLAIDFQRFESNLVQCPQMFVKKVFRGDYIRAGRSSFKVFAERQALPPEQFFVYSHTGAKVKVTGCVFGKSSSGFQIRMYNKSEEMRVKMHKPWVAAAWEAAGFSAERDTWRIEFQINVKDFMRVDSTTGDSIQSMKEISTINDCALTYVTSMLFKKHFKFYRTVKKSGNSVVRFEDSNKRRLPSFYPLDITDFGFVKMKIVPEKPSGRSERIEIKRLVSLYQEVRKQPNGNAAAVKKVLGYTVGKHGLHDWFKDKYGWVNFDGEIDTSGYREYFPLVQSSMFAERYLSPPLCWNRSTDSFYVGRYSLTSKNCPLCSQNS